MINFDLKIREFPFNAQSQALIDTWQNGKLQYGLNWPVVYIIHNDVTHEAYVGESLNAGKRAAQHWSIPERQRLKVIHIITDDTFNKSVILDLESFLIKYIPADGKYTLQNGNSGLSNFNYYGQAEYKSQFHKIWDELMKLGLVRTSITDIENSDLFKYSPYKALTFDQKAVIDKVLYLLSGYLKLNMEHTVLVEGSAGTGKTILAVFLMKLLADLTTNSYEWDEESEDIDVGGLQALLNASRPLKFGLVVPMQSLRQTLKNVFKSFRGLTEDMILSPLEVPKAAESGKFDLLICDEAHRLRRRVALSQYPAYDKNNTLLNLPPDATEMDWLFKCSHMQLLFYDSDQSIKPSDIPVSGFKQLFQTRNISRIPLTSQLRCLGGEDYISYVKDVLNCRATAVHGPFENYSLRFFENVDAMTDEINRLNEEFGLSYTVAGYGWKWITKDQPKDTPKRDITIGKGYIWNRTATDWVNSNPLPYEMGCIHTIQGYDLNYVGVVFGPEIRYDLESNRIEVVKEKYFDNLGRAVSGNYAALREYIINIYCTLMTRGIRGAFVYAYDQALRQYLKKYFGGDTENSTDDNGFSKSQKQPIIYKFKSSQLVKTAESKMPYELEKK